MSTIQMPRWLPRFEKLYVLYSFSFPRKFKIGYSWNIQERRADIEKSMCDCLGYKVVVRVAFCAPVLFARQIEQRLHRLMRRINCTGMVGSGKTEWFIWINAVTFFVVYFACLWLRIDSAFYRALIALFIPFPIDAALLVFVVAVVEYAAIIWALWNAFSFFNLT